MWLSTCNSNSAVMAGGASWLCVVCVPLRHPPLTLFSHRCLQQLLEDGFRLEDLFRSCTCEEEEAEMALKAVRRVKHGFQPPLPPPLHQTENGTTVPLLRDFYRTVSGVLRRILACDSWLWNLWHKWVIEMSKRKKERKKGHPRSGEPSVWMRNWNLRPGVSEVRELSPALLRLSLLANAATPLYSLEVAGHIGGDAVSVGAVCLVSQPPCAFCLLG